MFPESTRPRPGMRLAVIYDPKDHNRIELDHQQAAAGVAMDAVTAVAQPDLADTQVLGMPLATSSAKPWPTRTRCGKR
ncbi:hypothetical protein BZL30_2234 [Mycobacterium kansasii]|uniref:Uncharacterized protein n=1 Tax=Mycobacterium kansasii TaxID=1768 RepID=A0A1V3XI92_MYCKA|nr:hypothetical protein BZL30_2234 [Mycobacterium kansasii]